MHNLELTETGTFAITSSIANCSGLQRASISARQETLSFTRFGLRCSVEAPEKIAVSLAGYLSTAGRLSREMDAGLLEIAEGPERATARLRRLLATMMQCSCDRFLRDRKVHEIVTVAMENNWCATVDHQAAVENAIRRVIVDGRKSGEFEKKSPVDEICSAIVAASMCFSHPRLLESEPAEELDRRLNIVTSLVLRSLSL